MARRFCAHALSGALIGALASVGTVCAEIEVQIGTVEAAPGQRVAVPVVLSTNGAPLTAFQNDIVYPAQITAVPRLTDGRPDCAQNPSFLPGVVGSRYNFIASRCEPGVCSMMRAELGVSGESFPSYTIVAYTCTVEVASAAALGGYPLRCLSFETTDATGQDLFGTCADGAIIVVDDPQPAPTPVPPPTLEPSRAPTSPSATPRPPIVGTPTATLIPTPTGTPCAECSVLEVGNAVGRPGERVIVDLRLRTGESPIAALQADIGFSSAARIAAHPDGDPDCTFGAEPNIAGFSVVAFQPPLCGAADLECTGIRTIILPAELDALPDGALLLSCVVEIAADAADGDYPLPVSDLVGSTPDGEELALAGTSGSISVQSDVDAGQLPAVGGSDVTTAGGAGGGCAIAAAEGASGWWWLHGAAVIVACRVARRRAGWW